MVQEQKNTRRGGFMYDQQVLVGMTDEGIKIEDFE